jgi:hypothetical protein
VGGGSAEAPVWAGLGRWGKTMVTHILTPRRLCRVAAAGDAPAQANARPRPGTRRHRWCVTRALGEKYSHTRWTGLDCGACSEQNRCMQSQRLRSLQGFADLSGTAFGKFLSRVLFVHLGAPSPVLSRCRCRVPPSAIQPRLALHGRGTWAVSEVGRYIRVTLGVPKSRRSCGTGLLWRVTHTHTYRALGRPERLAQFV